ncbi:MAG: hypothetical protein RQ715_08250 [Methylococcales bacterium]|nr:hypothetical protein [Methylococcales bacterium]
MTTKVQSLVLWTVLAGLLNLALIRFLGQKSWDRIEHSFIGVLLLLVFAAFIRRGVRDRLVWVLMALLPCYLGTVWPDWDIRLLGIGGHRNPLFHSSLAAWILLALWPGSWPGRAVMVGGFAIGVASHLFWDVLFYGDVRWLPGRFWDRVWLFSHGLLAGWAALRSQVIFKHDRALS